MNARRVEVPRIRSGAGIALAMADCAERAGTMSGTFGLTGGEGMKDSREATVDRC